MESLLFLLVCATIFVAGFCSGYAFMETNSESTEKELKNIIEEYKNRLKDKENELNKLLGWYDHE